MCVRCGCGAGASHDHSHDHAHDHSHDHKHDHHHHDHGHHHDHHEHGPLGAVHHHETDTARSVEVEVDILDENNRYAAANRALLAAHGIRAFNLMSSPGAGKTTLLVRTLEALAGKAFVIEGDQSTDNDAARIRGAGAPAVQINTGSGCHLDGHMVGHALEEMKVGEGAQDGRVLFIENVGNLVCPAAFDLGETHKVVLLSVTEGEDKPIKYPHMFEAADVMLLTKIDLLPHLTFEVERCLAYARQVNPALKVLKLSATSGEGMDAWLELVEGA